MISTDVGYDAGKKIHGRKRHLTVDLLGLVLRAKPPRSVNVKERKKSSNEFTIQEIR